MERSRLAALPRYVGSTTTLLGRPLRFSDAASFLSAHEQIFVRGIYDFQTVHPAPRILDCGANIGLATIRWKTLFPDSLITAFEPEPAALDALRWNLDKRGLRDVEIVAAAVWDKQGMAPLVSGLGDAGHIVTRHMPKESSVIEQVPTVRLRDFLGEPVELLKLDIEGAETAVLADCADLLLGVQRLFVEWHSFVGDEQTLDEILGVLRSAGFRVQVESEFVASRPFLEHRRDGQMDHRVNIFATRET